MLKAPRLGPERQRRDDFALVGDGVDDLAEQHRLGDGDDGQDDIGGANERDALPVGGEIPKRPPIDFEQ